MTTGITNPKIERPYISMENFFPAGSRKIIQQELLAERKEEVRMSLD